ncbi:DMT family transporter [Rossellomorea vietnamensis]|uniref:DMT family transporter n=1 Tax=Rossellomorea vietnamensis TaxID=218284 RepID=A0A5D4MBV9_9BACI|nr:DMT family transporter [Rossellomorea vietnamensis]TYR99334.1 DMT family transporter [Rossellomorea vietnamensis]
MSKSGLYILLFLLMVVWGFNVSAIKILVTHFPPVLIQGVRVMLAGLAVIFFLVLKKSFHKVSRRTLAGILTAALFGVLGHHLFLAIGLTETTATNAGLILGLVPLSTSIMAMVFLNEKLTILKTMGIFAALFGVYLIVMNEKGTLSGLSIGDLYILGAVLTQAVSFILIKKLSVSIDSRQMTGLMLFMGSILLIIASFFFTETETVFAAEKPAYVWWALIGSAILATGLGHMLYNYSIHRLGAGATSIFINLTPFFSIVGSSLFLGEEIQPKHIVGFCFIVLGVLLGTGTFRALLKKRKNQKQLSA